MTDPAWHALTADTVLENVGSSADGLTSAEAARRFEQIGPNTLAVARPVSFWTLLLAQFRSLVVLLLVAATIGALLMGDQIEAAAIAVVLILNAGIGVWTEWRARQAMEALRQMELHRAKVLRDGKPVEIDARQLVPADVILIEAGDAIPADCRLLESSELQTNEAPLTGESVPVAKSSAPVSGSGDSEIPLAERTDMVYKGTLAVTGVARAVVVATGPQTEVGRISRLVQDVKAGPTPLEEKLDDLGKRLVWLTLAVGVVVVGLGILRGNELWLMIETGLALAIAAVPEGLPAVATITLAVGMRRMATRSVLIRKLHSVETLGSATVIATDKTGTLTAGVMVVTRIRTLDADIEVTGTGYGPSGEFQAGDTALPVETLPRTVRESLTIGLLASHAEVREVDGEWQATGDPTEAAMVTAARKASLERVVLLAEYPQLGEVPFSSERQFMATAHHTPDGADRLFVKGAPGRLAAACADALTEDGVVPLDESARDRIVEWNRELAGAGLRVLLVAEGEVEDGVLVEESAVADLTFVGLLGLIDPAAPGVKETIDVFTGAGVRTVMITGDQRLTAQAVARDLGVLADGQGVLSGSEFAAMSAAERGRVVETTGAYSRVSPEQKLFIIEALQDRAEIVGMLGDGVNDAAALRRSDIGVAMGLRGTDVAKETADVVLLDDRFPSIGAAVEEGRVIFDNIRKSILFLFSCNLAEVLVLFIAGLAGLPLPLLPLQLLWLNLVTDVFPALALAMEPAEEGVMQRPPRNPAVGILSGSVLRRILLYSSLITVATLGAPVVAARLGEADPGRLLTISFSTLAFAQLFHALNVRSDGPILFGGGMFANRWMLAALAVTIAMQLAAVYLPGLSAVLHTVALDGPDWAIVLPASLLPLLVGQAIKQFRR